MTTHLPQITRLEHAQAIASAHLADRSRHLVHGRHINGRQLWIVASESGRGEYIVTLTPFETCSCPDHQRRHVECKHIKAVKLLLGQAVQS